MSRRLLCVNYSISNNWFGMKVTGLMALALSSDLSAHIFCWDGWRWCKIHSFEEGGSEGRHGIGPWPGHSWSGAFRSLEVTRVFCLWVLPSEQRLEPVWPHVFQPCHLPLSQGMWHRACQAEGTVASVQVDQYLLNTHHCPDVMDRKKETPGLADRRGSSSTRLLSEKNGMRSQLYFDAKTWSLKWLQKSIFYEETVDFKISFPSMSGRIFEVSGVTWIRA